MGRVQHSVQLILLIAGVFTGAICAESHTEDLFPLPDVLKENVDFWIKAFSRYGSHQTIIHDSDRLNVIYEIVNVDSLFGGFNVSERTRQRKIDSIKKEYRAILLEFHKSPPKDTTGLSRREKRVYDIWRESDEHLKYRKAAYNIRSQTALRDSFKAGLKRSGRYIEEMKNIFRRTGVPEELINVALVESMFNYHTYSRMGAAGIWQFTRYTGREYLTVTYEVDERFDPLKSTEAAARLFKKNYDVLGNWPLAITAYNHGLNGMRRAKEKLNTSDIGEIVEKYQSRSFGFASRNFYAEFLAAKHVSENSDSHFGIFERDAPLEYIVFRTPDYVKLTALIEYMGLPREEVIDLNPSLRSPVLNGARCVPRGFELRIAWDHQHNIHELYAQIPDTEKFRGQLQESIAEGGYRVREGDTLSAIALRAGVSTRELMQLNGIIDPHRIYIGQVLRMPSKTTLVAVADTPDVLASSALALGSQEDEPIDSGYSDIVGPMPAGNESPSPKESESTIVTAYLVPGLTPSIDEPEGNSIRVESEETMGHYADWLEIPTQQIRKLNGLAYGADIHVGQTIYITFGKVSSEEFHRRRIEYHRGIREDFYQRFRIDSVRTHIVSEGENIWVLCREIYEVPLWLAIEYNSGKNLEKLKTGDPLFFPMLTEN